MFVLLYKSLSLSCLKLNRSAFRVPLRFNKEKCPPSPHSHTPRPSSICKLQFRWTYMRLLVLPILAAMAAAELPSYLRYDACDTPHEFYLYPLHTCTFLSDAYITYPVIYSILRPNDTELYLVYRSYKYFNCSDEGSPNVDLFRIMSNTCPSFWKHKGTPLDALPQLGPYHRFISFFPFSGCNTTVQQVVHVHDGCAWVGNAYANFKCQPDGTSIVQFHRANDTSCSQAPMGAPFTVQPSDCVAGGPVKDVSNPVYITTNCIHADSTATPTWN